MERAKSIDFTKGNAYITNQLSSKIGRSLMSLISMYAPI